MWSGKSKKTKKAVALFLITCLIFNLTFVIFVFTYERFVMVCMFWHMSFMHLKILNACFFLVLFCM